MFLLKQMRFKPFASLAPVWTTPKRIMRFSIKYDNVKSRHIIAEQLYKYKIKGEMQPAKRKWNYVRNALSPLG